MVGSALIAGLTFITLEAWRDARSYTLLERFNFKFKLFHFFHPLS
jgi:hypothetical protein